MTIPLDGIFNLWNIFLIVLVRISGMFFLSPIFGRRNIPNYYKVGFCFILTIITAQSITVPDISSYSSLVSYMALIGKELLLGVTIGFISYALFSAIYIAGQLIDTQIGFGMVNVIDPLTNLQIPITADFYVILATLFMLVTDTHHLLIKAIVDSYSIIPPGGAGFGGGAVRQLVDLFYHTMVIGFKIAAPVTAAILITNVALGIISKAMPQMNVFILGMPMKIIVGLIIILITIAAFRGVVTFILEGTYRNIHDFLRNAAGT
ncbi:MAG: flagellar type III secretion system protein FliR [Clostridiaceae bacterium]|jgi:flagellar biosynthetic protein FliR|nr:flagellar type III secretion system protein FliR [Clostridiaceae bacterium]